MKLGTETNSLVNHLFARGTIGQPKPIVGMGATLLMWTDRHAATIVSVEELISKRYLYLIQVVEDFARRVDDNGMSESQEYVYESDINGRRILFASDRNTGAWTRMRHNEKGRLVKDKGTGLRIGSRESYHDFSF